MPKKSIEFTEIVTVRLTSEMYRLVIELRRLYSSDADVVRAGIMALWHEYEPLPPVAEELPPDTTDPPAE